MDRTNIKSETGLNMTYCDYNYVKVNVASGICTDTRSTHGRHVIIFGLAK